MGIEGRLGTGGAGYGSGRLAWGMRERLEERTGAEAVRRGKCGIWAADAVGRRNRTYGSAGVLAARGWMATGGGVMTNRSNCTARAPRR